jgi:tetratricopeptide (TPR) repeat protein
MPKLSRMKMLLLSGLSLVAVAAVWFQPWRSAQSPESQPIPPTDPADAIPVRPDSELPYRPYDYQLTTEQAIRFFQDRVRNDPQNHLNLTILGSLYIRKAREIGDHAAYDKADDAFRRALAAFPGHTPARVGLALVTCARHKFAEGLQLAQQVYRESPESLEALVVVADAHLELGNYPEAEAALQELLRKGPTPPTPGIRAREARLAELKGNPDRAVVLLRDAADAERAAQSFKEPLAWYSMRLGEVLLSQGRLDEAARYLDIALKDHPTFPAALMLLGRVRVAQGRDDEASELFSRALRVTPDIPTIIAAADLHARRGETVPAKVFYDEVEKLDQNPLASRDLVLYYCDHDRKLPHALELAQREAAARKDIYTADTLAWALFKNGQLLEAEKATTDALRLGTHDALLLYHAGVIAQSMAKPDKARDLLTQALAVNPHFSVIQAGDARQRIGKLDQATRRQ